MSVRLVGIRRVATAAVLATLAGALAPARGEAQARPSRGNTLVSINPLGLPFEYVAAEIERKASNLATLGGSLSYLGLDDESYFSLEGKLRLYPNEEAFRGFSIGLGAGLSRVREDYFDGASNRDRSTMRPTIAVIADYNWLLGRNQSVLVGMGVGAKRILGDDDDFGNINFMYPTARFQVGVIF